ncbi:hypothetical protein [Streptomyces sp. NPDC000618]|uniref:hypothetical protein n=1 Tax=Streptomyces sp. NPDC000618 TaxID=3154265 RepID=UPI003333BC37
MGVPAHLRKLLAAVVDGTQASYSLRREGAVGEVILTLQGTSGGFRLVLDASLAEELVNPVVWLRDAAARREHDG